MNGSATNKPDPNRTDSSQNPICDSAGRPAAEVLPELLSKTTVCQLLDNVTPKHVENLVRSGRMPKPLYLGRMPRWNRSELLEWIHSGCPVLDTQKLASWEAELAARKAAAPRGRDSPGRRSGKRRRAKGSAKTTG